MTSGVLKIFPSNNEFIGEFVIENDSGTYKSIQTIIILDRSGSMGKTVERVINRILPLFFVKLSYRPLHLIYLITFESNTKLHARVVKDFPPLEIKYGTCTNMRPAVGMCQEVFENLDSDKPVRILTISDGIIQDPCETTTAADNLKIFLEGKGFYINSKAVRLFTSADQPDTTALCSLLQINNAIPKSLVDITVSESDDLIATKMAELFMTDNFNKTQILTTTEEIIRRKPWNKSSSKLLFGPGTHNFWIAKLPRDGFKLNGTPIRIVMQKPLTVEQHKVLLNSNSDLIVETMKVLKVVNSVQSNRTLHNVNHYFNNYIGHSALTTQLNTIANDQSVAEMTSSEKALYVARK